MHNKRKGGRGLLIGQPQGSLSESLPFNKFIFSLPQLRQKWFVLISELQISDPSHISVSENPPISFHNSVSDGSKY